MAHDFESCGLCNRKLEFDLLTNGLCGDCRRPLKQDEVEETKPTTNKPLPAYDPQVQEDRDFWAKRIGRAAAEQLCPECDPLPGERGF
tara:strand:+ start:525 stop:788 length:264 start_codon:yes stop_codon:yes gene_type:complete